MTQITDTQEEQSQPERQVAVISSVAPFTMMHICLLAEASDNGRLGYTLWNSANKPERLS